MKKEFKMNIFLLIILVLLIICVVPISKYVSDNRVFRCFEHESSGWGIE